MKDTRRYFNLGTCKTLKESPLLVLIFVDDDESKWTQEEIDKYWKDHVVFTKNFIENQARKYNVDINIECGYYGTNDQLNIKYNGIVVRDLNKEKATVDLMDQVIKCFGFSSKSILHKNLQKHSNREQIIYAFVLNKDGRSYALPHYCVKSDDHLEYCVVFRRMLGKKRIEHQGTLVHEILHLFGAEDYYDPYKKYPKRKRLAEKLCPNDIMLRIRKESYLNVIDKYTAYSIGWLDEMPVEYDNEDWWK